MKQGAIEAGYVNFGYFSPELSSDDEFPSYIKDNVDEVISKVKSLQTEDSVTFAFMTDIHYSVTENHDVRTKRLINSYNAIKDAVKIDMLVLGGDYVNNGNKEYNTKGYEGLKEHFKGINYYPINGNHDDNSFWDAYVENEKATNHHSNKEMYNLFYSHLPKLGAEITSDDVLYYYVDDNEKNVRYVFLDTNDIPEIYKENGSLKYTKQHTFGISQKQIDWLINTALKTQKNTDVVILAHNPPRPSYKLNTDEKNQVDYKEIMYLVDLFDAYNNKSSFSGEFGNDELKVSVNADFSDYNGKINAVFGGHHHRDIVEVSEGKIPFIFTDCTMMYNYGTERKDGEKSELLYDIVTIDRGNSKIYTTRIGAGLDREI